MASTSPPAGTEEVWINFLAANGDKQHIAVDSSSFLLLGSIFGTIDQPGQAYEAELILSGVTGNLNGQAYANADVSLGIQQSFTNAGQINFGSPSFLNGDFIFHDLHVDITADPAKTSDFVSSTIQFDVTVFGGTGNGIEIGVWPRDNAVPEPSTLALLVFGFLGAGFPRRRRAS